MFSLVRFPVVVSIHIFAVSFLSASTSDSLFIFQNEELLAFLRPPPGGEGASAEAPKAAVWKSRLYRGRELCTDSKGSGVWLSWFYGSVFFGFRAELGPN